MELENLGFSYTMEEFQSWSKGDLIQYLLSRSNTYCTRLAFKLIVHYQVKETTLINEILNQMMSYNMVDELVTFLPKISDMNNHLSSMWNSIVDTLLSKCHPNMDKFESEFERIIRTIISCPQVDYLNTDNIEYHLTRLNRKEAMSRIFIHNKLVQNTANTSLSNGQAELNGVDSMLCT
ncbi:hypothetical protein M8J75_008592 [Diaphorina citri]|nr:hypothetical protein M8J75_008592 [Diaphorina citri]